MNTINITNHMYSIITFECLCYPWHRFSLTNIDWAHVILPNKILFVFDISSYLRASVQLASTPIVRKTRINSSWWIALNTLRHKVYYILCSWMWFYNYILIRNSNRWFSFKLFKVSIILTFFLTWQLRIFIK